MRELVITHFQIDLPMNTPELTALGEEYQYPLVWKCRWYIQSSFLKKVTLDQNTLWETTTMITPCLLTQQPTSWPNAFLAE